MILNDDYVLPEDAAVMKGLSTQIIYRLCRQGILESVKVKNRVYVLRESVEALNTEIRQVGRPAIRHDMELATRCRQARLDSEIKFSEAARRLRISESTLSLRERGLRSISKLDLNLMAEVYGVSAKYLESGHK